MEMKWSDFMIVEIKNLVKRYGDFLAVDNVSFSIKEGEILGLLGPNGAGKSTTINMLTGLIPVGSGQIKILNKDIKKYEMEVKREIGIVPQDIALYDDLTAEENLRYFARLYGIRGKLLSERVDEALQFTGLLDKRKDYPKKFSGGMKRRLNIACAIAHHPKLVVMDEPTVGIDPQSRNHIMSSIKKLRDMGTTIIYTSHYMEEVEELCENIVILDHGRVIAKGSKDELKSLVSEDERVNIEVTSVNYTIVDCIKRIQDVKECSIHGNKISVISKKKSKNLSRIIECISNSDSEVVSFVSEKPTLESVFLTLTGRSLRD